MSRLSEYTAIATLLGTETMPVVDNPGVAGGTKKMTTLIAAQQFALLAPGAWTAVLGGIGFQNAWVNFGAPWQVAQYRKRGDMVDLRGGIKSGTINTTAFTLPAGFRPPADLALPAVSNSAFSYILVTAAGVVNPQVGSNLSVYFCVTFSTV